MWLSGLVDGDELDAQHRPLACRLGHSCFRDPQKARSVGEAHEILVRDFQRRLVFDALRDMVVFLYGLGTPSALIV